MFSSEKPSITWPLIPFFSFDPIPTRFHSTLMTSDLPDTPFSLIASMQK